MKKRQQAFTDKSLKMLKGALHAHTTRSDGVDTPEETIKYHYDRGYDFMMLSDHAVYNFKNDYCPDIPMTIIPGVEIDAEINVDIGYRPFEALCMGPTDDLPFPYKQDQPISASEKYQTYEEYQEYLDAIHDNGIITCICHPQRSYTYPRYLEKVKGHFALEIHNSSSDIEHDLDQDAPFWDELLDHGMKLYGVATDDDEGYYYSCHAWVRVKSPENKVRDILSALKNGEFYSSCGPEIYDFYVDGNKVVVECSDVDRIRLHCAKHPTLVKRSTDGTISRAEFCIDDSYPYIRATVIDKNGKHAWTNPIFLTDLQGGK